MQLRFLWDPAGLGRGARRISGMQAQRYHTAIKQGCLLLLSSQSLYGPRLRPEVVCLICCIIVLNMLS